MSAELELSGVVVSIADYEILRELSVQFPAGKVTCIVGKAGSGKSTLLKTAAGLIIPQHGQVVFRGKDLAKMHRAEELAFRKTASFAFQDAALWANQSIYNNLSLPLALHQPGLTKAESDRKIREMVQRVGYHEGLGFRPADLSTGEQKLISLARALILDPSVLFLDEPTASLDEDSVDTLVAVLRQEKEKGKTLIVVSHDGRMIADVADLLCVVSNGTVAGFGDVDQVAPLLGTELLKRIRAAHIRSASIDDSAGGA